ncbi:MAG: hypothetical protein WC670_18805 [Pseudolabrys sp.]|jgi:hypothetical protein
MTPALAQSLRRARLPGAPLAIAFALVLSAGLAAAAQPTSPAKPHRPRAAPPPRAEAPIICTELGCRPLPHCHAETDFTWEGPTGYQIIVCP